MTTLLAALGLGIAVFALSTIGLGRVLGLQPAAVLSYLVALLVYLGVLGGWKALVGWSRGEEPAQAHGWQRYVSFDVDHKVVGVQYIATTLVVFLVGGLMALLMRAEQRWHSKIVTPIGE